MPKPKPDPMPEPEDVTPNFEAALEELEGLVRKLESGELPLDESLHEFKRGVELTRHCQDVLDKAQLSVEQLMDVDDERSAEPFDPDGA
jgi:exodeoxyribonuclease VII small subunit